MYVQKGAQFYPISALILKTNWTNGKETHSHIGTHTHREEEEKKRKQMQIMLNSAFCDISNTKMRSEPLCRQWNIAILITLYVTTSWEILWDFVFRDRRHSYCVEFHSRKKGRWKSRQKNSKNNNNNAKWI